MEFELISISTCFQLFSILHAVVARILNSMSETILAMSKF
jgi:hypothetical protein